VDLVKLFVGSAVGALEVGVQFRGPRRKHEERQLFDAMTIMIKWVELSEAPDQMIGSHSENGKQVFTRPLCPFPKVAKYKRTGNKNDAGSFACQMP